MEDQSPRRTSWALAWKATLGAIIGIAVSSFAFALPHVEDIFSPVAASYLITGAAFGIVYVLTGSLTAAMVSHALQSCFSMAQVLLFGSAGASASNYILVFGCPIFVFFIARLLAQVLPQSSRATHSL